MTVPKNPPWCRDEHIIALNFYFQHTPHFPGKNSPEVEALSELLNVLHRRLDATVYEKFRNPNGVYMKLMNFRRFDPSYTGVGLAHGNKDEEVVWKRFAGHPEELRAAADLIASFARLGGAEVDAAPPGEGEDNEDADEGAILTRIHRYRETDRDLVRKKRTKFVEEHGRIFCQACNFDFKLKYGARGEDFIECHHIQPLSELAPTAKTKLSDLILLCSNCHRMIHRRRPWLTVKHLFNTINPDR